MSKEQHIGCNRPCPECEGGRRSKIPVSVFSRRGFVVDDCSGLPDTRLPVVGVGGAQVSRVVCRSRRMSDKEPVDFSIRPACNAGKSVRL